MKFKIALCITIVIFLLAACGEKTPTWQEQYDLGVRYLSEGDYEEAIIAFTAAIEIDSRRADAYVSLAETYRIQGDYDKMLEILYRGYEETDSPTLKKHITAEELNETIEREGYTALYSGLYQAFELGDEQTIIDAMQKYDSTFTNPYMENLADAPNSKGYLFDGQRFSAATDGKGLLFLHDYQLYWGEIRDGVPNGSGTMLNLHTWWQQGGIQCYICTGTWISGKIVGKATAYDGYSSGYVAEYISSKTEFDCVFDENEVMETAKIVETLWSENDSRLHQCKYTVSDGKLVQNDWEWVPFAFGGEYQVKCHVHENCGVAIVNNEFGTETYRNPYPLNGESAQTAVLFDQSFGYRAGDN